MRHMKVLDLYGHKMPPSGRLQCLLTRRNLDLNLERMKAQRQAREYLQSLRDSQANSTSLDAEAIAARLHELFQQQGQASLHLNLNEESMTQLASAWMTSLVSTNRSRLQ